MQVLQVEIAGVDFVPISFNRVKIAMSPSITSSMKSSSSAKMSRKKQCECGHGVLLLTSHSRRNPDRRFWRCINWKNHEKEGTKGYFAWQDEASSEDEDESAVQTHSCQNCEALNGKLSKAKMKLSYERWKVNVFVAVVVVSWAVTFAICMLSMLGGHCHV